MSRLTNISMIDVARRAGVGVGTVSRVINHAPTVRPDTAELVRRAMAGLGYKAPPPDKRRGPRIGASAANRKQTENGVLVILGRRGLRWILDCAPVFSYVLHGIETALGERGQNLLIRQVRDWAGMGEVIAQTDPQGIIYLGDELPGSAADALAERSLVWVMGSPIRSRADHIQPDHSQCGVLAAQWALRNGHRHCAVIGAGVGSQGNTICYRNDAFCWTIGQDGGSVLPLYDLQVILSTPQQNTANEAVLVQLIDQLLAANPRPTALLSQADLLTPTLYRLLTERGVAPQRDIQIITVNNERPYLTALSPQPVIIDLQAETIGRRAVDQLIWRLDPRTQPLMRILIEPLLVEPK